MLSARVLRLVRRPIAKLKLRDPTRPKPVAPTNGRKWKPGQSGNPAGRPPMSPEMKIAKKLTQAQFAESVNKLMYMSLDKLADTIKDTRNTSVIDGIIARILYKALSESSKAELNYFIERFLGKVPENHNIVAGNMNTALVDFLNQFTTNQGDDNGEEGSEET